MAKKRIKTFYIEHLGEGYEVYPKPSRYKNGRLKVILCEKGGEEFDTITIDIQDKLSSNNDTSLAFVDTISYPWIEKVLSENRIAFRTGKVGYQGWFTYPEYRFFLEEARSK